MAPGVGAGRMKSRALKELAAEHLGLEIQHGEHSPVEDARAALYLYQKHRSEWEREARGKGKGFVPYVYYGAEHARASGGAKKPKKPVCLLYSRGNHYDLLVR